jgi:hypothetical protein
VRIVADEDLGPLRRAVEEGSGLPAVLPEAWFGCWPKTKMGRASESVMSATSAKENLFFT